MESDLRITKSEITELKKSTSKLIKKMDAIEKEMRGLKTTMEDIQRSGGRQGLSSGSASSSSRHSSSDVSLLENYGEKFSGTVNSF